MGMKYHPIRTLRVSETVAPVIDTDSEQAKITAVYNSALNDPYAIGRIVSIEVDGITYSIEEIRGIIHG